MELNLNNYQKAIETLIEDGFTILQIFNQDGTAFYFIVHKFEESFSSSSQSVDFNTLIGINITEFMRVNGGQLDKTNLISRFNEFVNNAKVIRCEFSKNVRWFKWGSANS
jgi:hypothetical protein